MRAPQIWIGLAAAVLVTSIVAVVGQARSVHRVPIVFEAVDLPTAEGASITSLAVGPDRRLYGGSIDGRIVRWPIEADGTLSRAHVVRSLVDHAGVERLLLGLAFDPASTPEEPILWVTHSAYGFAGMDDWTGRVSRLSGPDLTVVQDVVVGLPRSCRDHATNGLAFGPDGALYIAQGSNTAMGAPDPGWCDRPERLLSASILRLDLDLVAEAPLDVKTGEGGAYDPFATGAPLTIHASGLRNPYGVLWHTNGSLYVPINGSASGGRSPAGVVGQACGGAGPYPGPTVPGLTGIEARPDLLALVEPGRYYGHPNPLRCEFVLDGGNPTPDPDPREVGAYPVGTLPDAAYGEFAFDFGLHQSPDGIVEYRSPSFGGRMQGAILVTRYSSGNDVIALRPGAESPEIVRSKTGIPGFEGFQNPLAIAELVPEGILYVSELQAGKVRMLRPQESGGSGE